ncbi:unnamed protein product [Linum tenue]|nr:unnamed protein product [Linum tenue]
MRRLSQRVRRRREATENPPLRTLIPHRLHRRLAAEQRQLPALQDQHFLLLFSNRARVVAAAHGSGFRVVVRSQPDSVPGKDRDRRGRRLRGNRIGKLRHQQPAELHGPDAASGAGKANEFRGTSADDADIRIRRCRG